MYKTSIRYGLIGGFILIVYSLLTLIIGIEHFVSMWIYMLTFVFYIVWLFITIAKQRKANGGFISFSEAFISGLIGFGITTGIATLYAIIYFNVISPEAKFELTDLIVENALETMDKFGAPQDTIDEFLENDAAEMPAQFDVVPQMLSYLKLLIFGAVLSLIGALIFKRKEDSSGSRPDALDENSISA